jgi:hypothetical protein
MESIVYSIPLGRVLFKVVIMVPCMCRHPWVQSPTNCLGR